MTRKKMRELSFKMVFSCNFYKDPELTEEASLFLEQQEELTDEEREMLLARGKDIFGKIEELDQVISENTEGWRIDRFSKVDLSLVRLALYEIRYDPEVPEKVAVNEAVELAKVFGGDDSPKFVNGVLARLLRAEKKEKEEKAEDNGR